MARVLVIDDEQVVRDLIVDILTVAGHEPRAVSTPDEALAAIGASGLDLVISDIFMRGLSGLQLLEEVRRRHPSMPVVLVTGHGTHAIVSEALAGGADGLVMKPFSQTELLRTVATALRRTARREAEVRDRLLPFAVAGVLSNAIEARDLSLEGHTERLADLAARIGLECGVDHNGLALLRLGAILHDVGKIGVPDRILTKAGALTLEERALMRTHPLVGDRLLEPIDALTEVRPVVRHHHERWDGNGYPDGLVGAEIPLAARIIAVADSVEAMSGRRSYRAPLGRDEILAELRAGRGAQWDPELVDALVRLIERGVVTFASDGLQIDSVPEHTAAAENFRSLEIA
jgi:putative two-component system response regulator